MRQQSTIWLLWTIGSAAAFASVPLLQQVSLALDPSGPHVLVAVVLVAALALISLPESLAVFLVSDHAVAVRWWLATALGSLAGILCGTGVAFIVVLVVGLSGPLWLAPLAAGAVGGMALGIAQSYASRADPFARHPLLATLSSVGGAAFALCLYIAILNPNNGVPHFLWGALCGLAYALPTSLIPLRLAVTTWR